MLIQFDPITTSKVIYFNPIYRIHRDSLLRNLHRDNIHQVGMDCMGCIDFLLPKAMRDPKLCNFTLSFNTESN